MSDEVYLRIVMVIGGGLLAIVGVCIVQLRARYVQTRGSSDSELRIASRKRLRELAIVTAGIVELNLFLWLSIVTTVQPGDGIRPMVEGLVSMLLSAAALIVGFVVVCEHLFLLRPRWYALVSLVLTAIAVTSFLQFEWYLSSIGVWYKP